jgi:hypothetical protein
MGFVQTFAVSLKRVFPRALRVALPWLNCHLVTSQVHRVHRSVDVEHHNRNFADWLPIFDIVFGTHRPPAREDFPETRPCLESKGSCSFFSTQFGPLLAAARPLRIARGSPERHVGST